jgi:hypothetical protein
MCVRTERRVNRLGITRRSHGGGRYCGFDLRADTT